MTKTWCEDLGCEDFGFIARRKSCLFAHHAAQASRLRNVPEGLAMIDYARVGNLRVARALFNFVSNEAPLR